MSRTKVYGALIAAVLMTVGLFPRHGLAVQREDRAGRRSPRSERSRDRMDVDWKRYQSEAEAAAKAGDDAKAEESFQWAISTAQRYGPGSLQLATSHLGLGDLYLNQWKYPAALENYRPAVPIFERILAAEGRDLELARILSRYGEVLLLADKKDEIEPVYRKALASAEKALGPENPELGKYLEDLGGAIEESKPTEAEALYLRNLKNLEKKFGPNATEIESSLMRLGDFYSRQNNYAKAEPFRRREAANSEKARGPEHKDTLDGFAYLAGNLVQQGKYKEAEAIYKRLLATDLKLEGQERLGHLSQLGRMYLKQKRYTNAETVYKKALMLAETPKGMEQGPYLISLVLDETGDLNLAQGKYADAEGFYKRSLALMEKQARTPDDFYVAKCFGKLALLYDAQGKYADAEPLFKRRLEILEKKWGAEHKDLLPLLEEYAASLRKANRVADAAPLEARAQAIRAKQAK